MAIYAGVATPEQTRTIYSAILQSRSPAWSKVATPYYNNYVLFAMSLAGHTDDAVRVIRDYWGGMLAEGATSWWEGYDPSWPKDDFHAHLQADDGTGYFVSLWRRNVSSRRRRTPETPPATAPAPFRSVWEIMCGWAAG